MNDLESKNRRLKGLLGDVESGSIKVPQFQRPFVWDDEQIINLLDSIYRGYPVGSLLLWCTDRQLPEERDLGGFVLPPKPAKHPSHYVLDGQQRLTTLYGVFHSEDAAKDTELAERFKIVFDPSAQKFMHKSAAVGPCLSLHAVLKTGTLLAELAKFGPKEQEVCTGMVDRMNDYDFPVVEISDREDQEVCAVFQRINSSGTNLGILDLLAAWTWSSTFDLRAKTEELLDSLASRSFDTMDGQELMRCLSAVLSKSLDTATLINMAPDDLRDGMDAVKDALGRAIDFLSREVKVRNHSLLPYPIMVVPLVRFYAAVAKPKAVQLRQMRKWFWHCAFSERYKAGTNRLVLEDMQRMDEVVGGKQPFDSLDAAVPADYFDKAWRRNSAASKAAICLLAKQEPLSFPSGAAVDLDKALSGFNATEFHHIYPKAHLLANGTAFHRANIIANICMCSAADNNLISDTDPFLYVQEVADDVRRRAFPRAFIPTAWDGTLDYEQFVAQRAAALADAAKKLIEQ